MTVNKGLMTAVIRRGALQAGKHREGRLEARPSFIQGSSTA